LAGSRPPRHPGLDDHRSAFDWQQALIEEARRRARQRRQRFAVLALLGGATIAIVVGFVGGGGVDPTELSGAPAPVGQGAAPATGGDFGNGKIAFADDGGRLQVAAPDGSKAQVIEGCEAPDDGGCELVQPAWSPDGKQIAFVRGSVSAGDRGIRMELSLYLRDSEGKVRRLAVCGSCGRQYGGRLSWSPDSSSIAFSREGEGEPWTLSLWVVDTREGKVRRLTDCQSCADVSPAWAPNGQLIAFNRLARGSSGLYTVHIDGTQLTKITDSVSAANPQWSPDGRQIAFDDNNDIFVANADGSDQRLLLDGEPGNGPGVPSWSPDGSKLAYFYTPGSPGSFTAEVWTMNTDGSHKRRVYHSTCCVGSWAPPIWSPDGRKIAFAADSAHGTFLTDADGTNLRQLSAVSANGLTWQRLP
jgi:Tol biopolymer transport system component